MTRSVPKVTSTDSCALGFGQRPGTISEAHDHGIEGPAEGRFRAPAEDDRERARILPIVRGPTEAIDRVTSDTATTVGNRKTYDVTGPFIRDSFGGRSL